MSCNPREQSSTLAFALKELAHWPRRRRADQSTTLEASFDFDGLAGLGILLLMLDACGLLEALPAEFASIQKPAFELNGDRFARLLTPHTECRFVEFGDQGLHAIFLLSALKRWTASAMRREMENERVKAREEWLTR